MHELSTVSYVVRTVENICRENNVKQVLSVTLQVGEVSGIVPELLQDCWEWATGRSEFMKGAEMKVEPIPAVTRCNECGCEYETVKYKKICPCCGSDETYLLHGNEYNIKEIAAAE